jgi:GNAT superfamily N-acetyltransferase
MRGDYQVIRYRPELKQQVAELQRPLWGPLLTINSAYLEWKHEHNPYIDAPLIYVALRAGQVVGMRGFCGARWRVDDRGETILIPLAGDFVIAPGHRNRGLFTRIMATALNDLARCGYTYTFNLGAGPVTFLGSLATGWRALGSLQPLVRRERRASVLRHLRRRLARTPVFWRCANWLSDPISTGARDAFEHLDRNAGHPRSDVSPHVSVGPAPRPEAMAELVERTENDGRIRHVRDACYFGWRFRDPLHAFRFVFWDDAGLQGYLVLHRPISPNQNRARVSIVDWEAANEGILDGLFQAVIRLGRFPELLTWSVPLSERTRTLLRGHGFAPFVDESDPTGRLRPSVLIRPVADDGLAGDWTLAGRRLLDMKNWNVRLLDRM